MNTKSKNLPTDLSQQVKEMIENHYDLGTYAGAEFIHGGTVNRSFLVRMFRRNKTDDYFLREYNPAIQEEEIRFEHALLKHLRNDGFDLASIPFTGSRGSTYFRAPASTVKDTSSPQQNDHFWALFEFMNGQDKYTWTETDLSKRELESSAEILARLHHHGANFVKPSNANRSQPPIMDLLPILKRNFTAFTETARESRCRELFKLHVHRIRSILDTGLAAQDNHLYLLKIPIHCDFHPGNLKFENGKGVGLFDFDWSKIDYRVFDLALALFYFSAQWKGDGAGCLQPDSFRIFLSKYQETCTHMECVCPMTPSEVRALVPMLAYANLYVLNWSVIDFSEKADADDNEYFTFIRHGIRVMEWIESHKEKLERSIAECLV